MIAAAEEAVRDGRVPPTVGGFTSSCLHYLPKLSQRSS